MIEPTLAERFARIAELCGLVSCIECGEIVVATAWLEPTDLDRDEIARLEEVVWPIIVAQNGRRAPIVRSRHACPFEYSPTL